jgi:hypothetical protein
MNMNNMISEPIVNVYQKKREKNQKHKWFITST